MDRISTAYGAQIEPGSPGKSAHVWKAEARQGAEWQARLWSPWRGEHRGQPQASPPPLSRDTGYLRGPYRCGHPFMGVVVRK